MFISESKKKNIEGNRCKLGLITLIFKFITCDILRQIHILRIKKPMKLSL